MLDLVIKNADVVAPDGVYRANIGVQDGKIATIFKDDVFCTKEIIDAKENLVFPGIIDGHVHFNDPGYTHRENFACGTAAAAVGGVTTIVDMPMLNEHPLTNKKIFQEKHHIVSPKSIIDYAFWGGAVNDNLDNLEELGEYGVVAFKCFTCRQSYGYTHLDHEQMRYALSVIKKIGGVMGFHCEDDMIIETETKKALARGKTSRMDYLASRPVLAELTAVKKVIALSKELGAYVHICHVSHPLVAEEIKRAKADGVLVTAETCSHYLVFTGQDMIEKGMLYKCSPPLRSKMEVEAMWSYLKDKTIDTIGSDHSPAPAYEKTEEKDGAFGAWGGISGVQTTLCVMYEQAVNKQGLSPTILTELLCRNPAKLYGLCDRKGAIQIGLDADFTIFNPNQEWEITDEALLYLNKISAFSGQKGKGFPVCTVLRGKVIASEGMVVGENGYGQLLKRCK